MSDKLITVTNAAKILCDDVIKFLSDMKLRVDKLTAILEELNQLKSDYNSIDDKGDDGIDKKNRNKNSNNGAAVYVSLSLIVYYNILRKFESTVIFFELSENAEKNKSIVELRNALQSKCRDMVTEIEQNLNRIIKPDIFKTDYIKLYNRFGFSDILRFAGGIEKHQVEKLKDELLKTDVPYTPEPCKWTYRIDKEGVYDVHHLTHVTELATPPTTGVNYKLIKAFNTIDTTREPAVFHEKHLPERSRVAIYNATLEKMIFDKRTPCTKYQFTKVTNVNYQIINFINYDNLQNATSLDQVIEMISADIYRIMATKYEESNSKLIQNKREIFYYSYLGTFGVVNIIQRRLRESIKELASYKFPIKDYSDKLAFAARVKRIITNTVEAISFNKMVENIDLTICS